MAYRLTGQERRGAFEAALPAFLTLLDLPVDDRAWQTLDPAGRRRRTLEALKRLLLRESQVQPLALVFEDLHWIDGETQALLDSLVEGLPGARLLLLVSHRSEYAHDWGRQASYTQLRIEPLPRESAEVLLEVLLGSDPGLDPLKRLLMERTEGNPLFVEESVRALVETGALTGPRGAYQLARGLPAIHVPATVQAILTARIDRLPPGEKRLLETAAVIGKDFAFALLETVADENEETLRRGLGHLQTAEFLYETRSFPDLEYTFKHALTHEVVYRGLLHEQRRALHARIASAIAAFDPDRLSQHGDRLAHHAFLGGLWPQAVVSLGQAGERALAVAAYMPAVSLFDRALAALQHLPEGPETRRQAVSLHLNIRHALQLLGELERCGKHLEEAERLAEAGGDQRELARVHSLVAQHFRLTGDLARAVASGERAADIAERLGDFALRVQANGILGSVYYSRGDYRKAAEVLRACAGPLGALPHSDRSLDGLIPIFWHFYVVACLAQLGDFSEALDYADAGLRIAEAADYGYGITFACWGRGTLALLQGDAPQAVVLLERALALARTLKVRGAVPPLASSLGAAYSLSGRSSDAISLLEEGVRESASMKRGEGHSLLLVRLAEAYLLVGRIEDATSTARQALRLAHEKEERGHEAYAMYMLGESALSDAPANMAAAEISYRRGAALAEELLMRPLVAHCHLGLGKLYRRTGKRQDAQEHLTTATTMYREMDMWFWLEQAADETAALA